MGLREPLLGAASISMGRAPDETTHGECLWGQWPKGQLQVGQAEVQPVGLGPGGAELRRQKTEHRVLEGSREKTWGSRAAPRCQSTAGVGGFRGHCPGVGL